LDEFLEGFNGHRQPDDEAEYHPH